MSSKYYNLKKFNPDEEFNFILFSKIEKIEHILYNSYESDCGIGKANYIYIMRFINRQQREIEDFENIKNEHRIMKRIIQENGIWETLLNDNEFSKYLKEEN